MLKPDENQGYVERVSRDEFTLVYILRGQGIFTDQHGQRHRVEAGNLIPHVPGLRHSVVPEPDGLWAEFFVQTPSVFYFSLLEMGHLPSGDALRKPGLAAPLFEQIEVVMKAARDVKPWAAAALLARAHALIVELYRAVPRSRPADPDRVIIDAVCTALAGNLDTPVDLSALAAAHGISYERLRKKFRDRVGVPPGEFRIRRRIDRARALIAEEGCSNKAVAYQLGYPDPFTFSRQFKKYVGISPSAFRASL
ncbi:MAG: AraC family transcriptional regulator [Planctomycetota bacterium]